MSAEESGLEQIDEDEWTDRNFGNSTANDMNTSEDSVSDLESDNEDCEVGIEDLCTRRILMSNVFPGWG